MAFEAGLTIVDTVATITLSGELDAAVAPLCKEKIDEAARHGVTKLVLLAAALTYMSSAGLRALVFAKQKMGQGVTIVVVGAQPQVIEPIRQTGFHRSVILVDAQ